MALTREKLGSALIEISPLLGVPTWVFRIFEIDASPHADYDDMGTFFAGGLFMLGAGLVVATLGLLATRIPSVRATATAALRFQLWVLAACVAIGGAVLLLVLSDKGVATLEHRQGFMLGVYLAALAYGIALPLLQAGRAIVLAVRTLTR
jgi:hypothetical protein